MCVCVYIYILWGMCVYIYIYILWGMCIYIYIVRYVCVYIYIFIVRYVYIYIYSEVCVYIYIYTHTHTSQYRNTRRAKEMKINWDSPECRVLRKLFLLSFWSRAPYVHQPWPRNSWSGAKLRMGKTLLWYVTITSQLVLTVQLCCCLYPKFSSHTFNISSHELLVLYRRYSNDKTGLPFCWSWKQNASCEREGIALSVILPNFLNLKISEL